MPRKVKGFSRVDSGDAHGWLVRIKRGDITRSRFISDSTNGGKSKSKAVAQKVYQDWVAELPEPETAEDKLGKRNNSGVVGVHYSHDVDSRYPGCSYEYYIASWKTDEGKRRNVRFAISRWGKKGAFDLACIARELRTGDRATVEKEYEKRGKKGVKAVAKKAAKNAPAKAATAKKTTKKTVKKAAVKKTATKAAKKKTARKR